MANCKEYSRTVNGQCDQCEDSYFVDGVDCRQRQVSLTITNCNTLNLTSDTCLTCKSNFEINSEGTACFNQINFCALYQKDKTTLKCIQCLEKYYLKDNICELGAIPNCLVYNSATSCQTCQNNYYLAPDGTCVQNTLTSLLNCQESSSDSPNKCVKCSSD